MTTGQTFASFFEGFCKTSFIFLQEGKICAILVVPRSIGSKHKETNGISPRWIKPESQTWKKEHFWSSLTLLAHFALEQ